MEKINTSPSDRRSFLKNTIGFSLTLIGVSALAERSNSLFNNATIQQRKPPLPTDLVFEFVRVAHFDLNRVKEMLKIEPALVNACWDWGGGDFETALGGASHMGNRLVAAYLLQEGARKDVFCAAMLGDHTLVSSFIASDPDIANVLGPHSYTLLYHVALNGNVEMADTLKPHIKDFAMHCNRALQAAAREGHLPMVDWLLSNGATNPNILDFAGNTPLQIAEKNGHAAIVAFLKRNGAR